MESESQPASHTEFRIPPTGVPNAFPNDHQAYFKLGLYKWWWKTRPSDVTERTLYYGDIEMKVLRQSAD
ncbi:polysaccharide lyase [Burkholderia cenocepacia]|uniref:polysaccharide lyase n=1 Tax=Burkholderia cenocepacia TaxID=95486 RepID=UPI0022373983|nr:polysaccharide lyase [Burkholderia cenocepacia]MCW5140495.1 polysaccharide lyase [Burkholderia cenocepacia]